MEQSLDDVLSGEPAQEPEVSEPAAEEPKGEEIPEAEVKAEAETKPEELVEPPSTEKQTEEPWTKTAYLDEKRKRQKLEAQIEASKQEKPKAPDIFENQDDYTGFVQSEINSAVGNTRAEMSEFYARREYGDAEVSEKMEKFEEMAKENPALMAEVRNSVAPWHTMVEKVDAAQKMAELQDVPAYEAKVRAEIEAKVRAEIMGEKQVNDDKLKNITPSLAGQRSSGSEKTPIDQSLEDIFGR